MDESMEEDRSHEVINPIGDEDLTGAKSSPEEPVELTLPDMGIPKETDKNLTMEQRMEALETRILGDSEGLFNNNPSRVEKPENLPR